MPSPEKHTIYNANLNRLIGLIFHEIRDEAQYVEIKWREKAESSFPVYIRLFSTIKNHHISHIFPSYSVARMYDVPACFIYCTVVSGS